MAITFPGESAEYRAARDRLLSREMELRRAMEAVAAARRELPPGGVVPVDYAFDAADGEVRLSQLFAPGRDSLAIYSFMFAESPCPSCTAFLDQLDGAAEHAGRRLNLAVIAKAPIERVLDYAAQRGWRRLRMLSSAGTTYNRDYHGETESGSQMPMLNVFQRDGATIRHFWSSELLHAPTDDGQDPRHVGTIEPLWNLFDFTREGRPRDFEPQIAY